jgi:hypothetical protein
LAQAAAALAGQSAAELGYDPEGREWLRSYVPIAASGWAVVAAPGRGALLAARLPGGCSSPSACSWSAAVLLMMPRAG